MSFKFEAFGLFIIFIAFCVCLWINSAFNTVYAIYKNGYQTGVRQTSVFKETAKKYNW